MAIPYELFPKAVRNAYTSAQVARMQQFGFDAYEIDVNAIKKVGLPPAPPALPAPPASVQPVLYFHHQGPVNNQVNMVATNQPYPIFNNQVNSQVHNQVNMVAANQPYPVFNFGNTTALQQMTAPGPGSQFHHPQPSPPFLFGLNDQHSHQQSPGPMPMRIPMSMPTPMPMSTTSQQPPITSEPQIHAGHLGNNWQIHVPTADQSEDPMTYGSALQSTAEVGYGRLSDIYVPTHRNRSADARTVPQLSTESDAVHDMNSPEMQDNFASYPDLPEMEVDSASYPDLPEMQNDFPLDADMSLMKENSSGENFWDFFNGGDLFPDDAK